MQSSNFELYSGSNARSARDTIQQFEQVRGFFVQVFGAAPGKQTPVRLVAFASGKEYEPYRLNEFASAYYLGGEDRDYIVMSHGGADIFPIAVHEYVHLLVKHEGLRLPPWLNEGLAEVYSTLHPAGDKIVVGTLIPGRHRALLTEKWVPLNVILTVDHSSPYYNEKNKAGSLYNEGWALTHMLSLSAEYRPGFPDLMRAISGGEDSAAALQRVYRRAVGEIDKDLQAYLRGTSFRALIVPAKLEKQTGELAPEPVPEFDRRLLLTDLLSMPGKQAARRTELESLVRLDPKRPEPYRGLGYLEWRAGRAEEAVHQFGKAFECGDRSPKMLWDYGRLLEGGHDDQAIAVLAALLTADPSRLDVRYELAQAQVRNRQGKEALATMAPIRTINPADAERYFRIAVYAHLYAGDRRTAEATAKRFLEVAKTDSDRASAAMLLRMSSSGTPPAPQTGIVREGEKPVLRRAPPAATAADAPAAARRQSVTGRFLELQCGNKQARMVIESAGTRKTFLIADPGAIAIAAGAAGPVDLACGPQKTPPMVAVDFDPPDNRPGIDGIVRALTF